MSRSAYGPDLFIDLDPVGFLFDGSPLRASFAFDLRGDALPDSELSPEQIEALAAQQAATVVEGLVQQGMLCRQDGSLSAEFEFGDGMMTVNGMVIPMSP